MNKSANPWAELSLPPEITKMRSMLSHEEKQYLVWLTAVKFEGWGAIVDLGPWLGSSAALAEGRCGEAEKEALDVLRGSQGDESTIDYSLKGSRRSGISRERRNST